MAMNRTISQQSTYVDKVADLATKIAALIDEDAHVILLDWFAGMNNLLTDPAAFAGTEYDKDKVTAMMTTIITINGLMDAPNNHRTNVYNMKKP